MRRTLFLALILCSVQAVTADVLADFSLRAPGKKYHKVHPKQLARKVVFDIPGAGFIRYCYTDSAYNGDADSGGLSWRNVPGATNYAKAPGEKKHQVKKPEHPRTGNVYKLIIIREVDRAMKNVGIVLTPRYRRTWNEGGVQYLTDLQVKLEWSPHPFDVDEEPSKKPPFDPREELTIPAASDQNILKNGKPELAASADSTNFIIDGDESHGMVTLVFNNPRLNDPNLSEIDLVVRISNVPHAGSSSGFKVFWKSNVIGRSGRIKANKTVVIPLDVSKVQFNERLELTLKGAGKDGVYIKSKSSGQGASLKLNLDK